jgi:hypothetical protein
MQLASKILIVKIIWIEISNVESSAQHVIKKCVKINNTVFLHSFFLHPMILH